MSWLEFVKNYRIKNPNLSYKQCLIDCKKLYKKEPQGGMSIRMTYPPKVRKFLELYGDRRIISMSIVRRPLASYLNTFVNLTATKPHDKLFHLFSLINLSSQNTGYTNSPIFVLEKNEDVQINDFKRQPYDEFMNVNLKNNITLNQLLNNTLNSIGPQQFFEYNAFSTNCQEFQMQLLRNNGLLTNNLYDFIMQNVNDLVPHWTKRLAYFFTTLKNKMNQIVDGKGIN